MTAQYFVTIFCHLSRLQEVQTAVSNSTNQTAMLYIITPYWQ